MGTPDFAIPTFEKLIHSSNHQIVSVFTQIPKSQGRGLNKVKSPIHQLALKYNIITYTPTTLKTEETISVINAIDADVIVVVAYGFLIPLPILQSKKYGCLNVHPSSLPRHRGAAPLQRIIIEGDSDSSVCIMKMDEGLDTGDIILQQKFILSPRITMKILHDKCAMVGADLLIKVLDEIDNLPRITQDKHDITYAHKLKKEEGRINWHETAYQIDCKIRGMNPWPGVYFDYNRKIIKILKADYINLDHQLPAGTIFDSSPDQLIIACGQDLLTIQKLQQEGRKPLSTEEFLRGVQIPTGTILK